MNTRRWTLASGRALLLLACGIIISAAVHATPTATDSDPLLAQLDGVKNIKHPYSWLLTGGQPSAVDVQTLAKAGAWTVMDLRTADESRGFDERETVKSAGLKYLSIPTGENDFTDRRLTAFRHHLIAHGPKHPLFIHCASGNRVGAAILPWLVLDEGMDEDLALEVARDVGLRDQGITDRALDYIHAREHASPVRN